MCYFDLKMRVMASPQLVTAYHVESISLPFSTNVSRVIPMYCDLFLGNYDAAGAILKSQYGSDLAAPIQKDYSDQVCFFLSIISFLRLID